MKSNSRKFQRISSLYAITTFAASLAAGLALTGRAATLSVSPDTVGSDYTGVITLQIGGLTTGETVLVEKFADFNGNGKPDTGELTLQAFTLRDGQAVVYGGVTNLHVPGDLNASGGTITAQVDMLTSGFIQRTVGKYVYRVSSPSSRFTAVLTPFTITNGAYTAQLSGNVTSGGAKVPNAVVVLFRPLGGNNVRPVVSATADANGHYSLTAPPGTFMVAGFKNGYVTSFQAAPIVTLASGGSQTAAVSVAAATRTLSGRLCDASDTTQGLGGLLVPCEGSDGNIAVAFPDKDGNFSVGVSAAQYRINPDEEGVQFLNHLATQNRTGVDATSGNVSGVTVKLPAGTALLYGTFKNNDGTGIGGIQLYSEDDQGRYSLTPTTDAAGRYFVPMLAGNWTVGVGEAEPALAGYIYTASVNGVAINPGQAVSYNFTAMAAPYRISGSLSGASGPIPGMGISGWLNVNGNDYNSAGMTDDQGQFSLPAVNGQWVLNVQCEGDDGLGSLGYKCIQGVSLTVTNGNANVNLIAQACTGLRITTTQLNAGTVGQWYSQNLSADTCSGNLQWSLASGNLPPGLSVESYGVIDGTPTSSGTYNFAVRVSDNGGGNVQQSLSITINSGQPVWITTFGLDNATLNKPYNVQLSAQGGAGSYTWSLAPGSAGLPNGLSLNSSGLISGTPTQSGSFSFKVRVTDMAQSTAEQVYNLTISAAQSPLTITTTSLPNGMVGTSYSASIQLSGGVPPYRWNRVSWSGPLPDGLQLNETTGEISGTPSASGSFTFIIDVNDSDTPIAGAESLYTITIAPRTTTQPALSRAGRDASGNFGFLVSGAAGVNYTIQNSTDLQTWNTLGQTNAPSGSVWFNAGPVSGSRNYYRIQVMP